MRLGRWLLGSLAVCSLLFAPALAKKDPPPIEIFNGILQTVNAPTMRVIRVRIQILRWSTDEERKALQEALIKDGTQGLVKAMEKIEPVAYIQFDNSLRHMVRVASTWTTDQGRAVRLATDRNITYGETVAAARSMDYPIGIAEFTLPHEGEGEGTLIGAVRARFNDAGRLEVQSLPQNMGPQRLTSIKNEPIKP